MKKMLQVVLYISRNTKFQEDISLRLSFEKRVFSYMLDSLDILGKLVES